MKYTNRIVIAFVALLSGACANDDYVNVGPIGGDGGAIGFGSGIEAVTRAASGKDAADKLGSSFYVFGIKNETGNVGKLTAQNLVFDNYKVTYSDGSANSSASNSSGWEYVGVTKTSNENTNISREGINASASPATQTIKYWDANATDYTYYAFSAKSDDITAGKMLVEKNTSNTGLAHSNGYTVKLAADADPTSLYFSNRLNIEQTDYNKPVKFTFRNAMAKVRVGMYETIPGYSVTIDGFQVAESSTTPSFGDMTTVKDDKFAANLASNKKGDAGTMKVTYKSSGDDENRPVVSFGEVDNNDFKEKKDAVLYLGTNLQKDKELKTSTAELVYDDAKGAYTDVYPMENNVNNLKLKVDFTLHSKVGETITVKGATAEVPAQYLQWKPGCAYTYIFKISDQTNGVLGSLTGLHPITFEAVNIIDGTGEDELISTTTAANYNIITFGCDAQRMVTVGQDDYNTDDIIYAVVIDGSGNNADPAKVVTWDANATDKATKLYEVTTTDDGQYPITEASVENYLNNYESDQSLIDQPVTAIPTADGIAEYVTEVPKGDETSGTNSLNAMKWKAKKTVYAVEYTVPNTSSSSTTSGTKYYKVVRVDGFGGEIKGELTLSQTEFENGGGTTTATLKINKEEITSGVTYALDTAGKYGTAVPSTVTIDSKTGVVTVPGSTTAATNYTVIATYNRRTYTAQFTVKQ